MSKYADRLAHLRWNSDLGVCPDCESDLVEREGRFGAFIGCISYPQCTFTQEIGDRHERGEYSWTGKGDDGHHY